ncbi:hypothetical protein [Streptomyces sp. SP18CS02]|uniref:hypothetical protein n=1 Tax=Streptomyces sp. SP18CS02 TaxID=3002531 RepID=UPI002E7738C0|nr:hypothetical protein [Streptomyces sp. SP18CS02]MEE1751161.1 hypothetical protein [Streptomyces sp. SP18CS02]
MSGGEQGDLFADVVAPDGGVSMEHVRPFMAPVAADVAAVTEDPLSLRLAEAIHDAFGDLASDRGLTRSEIAAACVPLVPEEVFNSRFKVFTGLGLLRQRRGKAYEGRYVFNPTSAAALLVFERLTEAGGVEEIMTLLDRARDDLQKGLLSEQQLAARLLRARRSLAIHTGHLLELVHSKTIEELEKERHHHRSGAPLLDHAHLLVDAVSSRFPALRASSTRLIDEALRYSAAVEEFFDRLLQQARARRDFSMLLPEQYVSAARSASVDALADVFAGVVFDPAGAEITTAQVLIAAQERRPPPPRRRPERPAALPPGPDPVEMARRRVQQMRRRRAAAAEQHLQGRQEADPTDVLRAWPWRSAIIAVVDLLQASADPAVPFFVDVGHSVLVSSDGPVSYASPLVLYRVPDDVSQAGGEASWAQEDPA